MATFYSNSKTVANNRPSGVGSDQTNSERTCLNKRERPETANNSFSYAHFQIRTRLRKVLVRSPRFMSQRPRQLWLQPRPSAARPAEQTAWNRRCSQFQPVPLSTMKHRGTCNTNARTAKGPHPALVGHLTSTLSRKAATPASTSSSQKR